MKESIDLGALHGCFKPHVPETGAGDLLLSLFDKGITGLQPLMLQTTGYVWNYPLDLVMWSVPGMMEALVPGATVSAADL